MLGQAYAMFVHLHNQSNVFYKWNAIAARNTMWAHLECVHLVSDQTFLDVNLIETYEIYHPLSIPNSWKHYLRPAEAVFWTPEAAKANVSVVPVRFAFLETLFLQSESIREVFWQAIIREV